MIANSAYACNHGLGCAAIFALHRRQNRAFLRIPQPGAPVNQEEETKWIDDTFS
jgi:hypothetical protein